MGSRIGPYVIEGVLGRGGMGAVLRGRHAESGAVHAVKVVLKSRLRSPRALERFRREIEVLARIQGDPHVVGVHACGLVGETPWAAMDLVEGTSLAAVLERDGPMSSEAAAELVSSLAAAMARVHRLGVVHRDLKPENVVIAAGDGAPRIVDFGLAYDAFADELTATGECLGTPAFMAPEQVSRRSGSDGDAGADADGVDAIGPSTDVYGLGGILYAVLTGRPPFVGDDPMQVLVGVMRRAPLPPRRIRGEVAPDLEAICLRCLEKDPEARYATATELADDIERWRRGDSVDARRDRLRRMARGLLPRSAAGRAAAGALGLAFAAALVAVGLELDPTGGGGDETRLAAFAADLGARGGLDDAQRDELRRLDAKLSRDPEAGKSAERAALLAALAAVAAAEPDAPVADLADRCRRDGRVDADAVELAASTLRAAGRLDALGVVLWGAAPVAPVPFDLADDLARAAATLDGPPPPEDAVTLAALLRAAGLTDAERGAILVRRSEQRRAHDRTDEAVDDLVRAFSDHGVTPDGSRFEPAFRRALIERFLEDVRTGSPDVRRLGALLTRAGGSAAPLAPDLLAALQSAAGAGSIVSAADASQSDPDRILLIGPVIVAHRGWPIIADKGYGIGTTIAPRRLVELARAELSVDPRRRDPARLVILAQIVKCHSDDALAELGPGGRVGLITRLTNAAVEAAAGAEWIELQVGYVLYGVDPDVAEEACRRSVELDRRRPDVDRAPAALVNAAFASARHRDVASAHRIASLGLEAARIQIAVRPRIDAITEATAFVPWVLIRYRATSQVLSLGAERCVELEPPACCGGPTETGGTFDLHHLIETGISMVDAPFTRIAWTLSPMEHDASIGRLLGVRARHHRAHGRREAALVDLLAAVDAEVEAGRTITVFREARRERIAKLHDARAELLDELGRVDEAEAARAEAARHRGSD